MFAWFAKKNSDAQERALVAAAVLAIDPSLKQVENYWFVSRHKEGDQLLREITENVTTHMISKDEGQFYALKSLVLFLQRHRKDDHLSTVFSVVRRHAKVFNHDQLEWLLHQLNKWEIAMGTKDDHLSSRLIYYVCQECGHPNLRATEPCINCGFCPSTQPQMRRAILLSSVVLESHSLLAIARTLNSSVVSNPKGPTLEQLWNSTGGRDLDGVAAECAEPYEAEIPDLLNMCRNNSENFVKPAMVTMTCLQCSKSFGIFTHLVKQRCLHCGAEIKVPAFRRLKAGLYLFRSPRPQQTQTRPLAIFLPQPTLQTACKLLI